MAKRFPGAEADAIPNLNRIIGLRNIIAHGCDVVDHLILWDVIQNHLPPLLALIEKKLGA